MLEEAILGIAQGMLEWVPVSSEGVIAMLSTNLFNYSLIKAVQLSLFLHMGTLLSVLVYYRKEFIRIIRKPFSKLTLFLISTTLFSGITGAISYLFLERIGNSLGFYANILISLLLLITAYAQLRTRAKTGFRKEPELKHSVLVGLAQGFSALPGISRSGITISALLFLNYDKSEAFKLSFLMSVPAVILANVFLKLNNFAVLPEYLLAGTTAFIAGLLSIDVVLKTVRKMEFWKVCVILAMINTLLVLI